MKLTALDIPGAYRVEMEPIPDERGFFARAFCPAEFAAHGIRFQVAQCSVSFNRALHTLRGMHYQIAPCPEIKLVRCTAGKIWDCVLDLRPGSPTYLRWAAEELSSENHRALLIPEHCAHGFITLTSGAEVFYMMSSTFDPSSARTVRWNDPAFNIEWPAQPAVISTKDAQCPDFNGSPV